MTIKENISLLPYNSFAISAKAKYFIELNSADEITEILHSGILKKKPYLILGAGCNTLFTKDFDGIILKINTKGIEMTNDAHGYAFIRAFAGEDWDNFVEWCLNNDFFGIENLSLIPGTVGAGPIQNIGAYGVEFKDVLFELNAINLFTGKTKIFSNSDCAFGYRDSVFKHKLKNQFLILSVTFKLNKTPDLSFDYADLKNELNAEGITKPDAKIIRNLVCRIRKRKLPYPADLPNAGSFFKNPVINKQKFNELLKLFPDIKYFELPEEKFKISAAWLIEKCGWKGKRTGNAGVHINQPLVIVNYGNATGDEILTLAENIIDSVLQKFNITLEPEVNII